MKTTAKAIWKAANLAPTGAALLMDRTGASERTKTASYWIGWSLDWIVPGLPVGSGSVALIAATWIASKKAQNFLSK